MLGVSNEGTFKIWSVLWNKSILCFYWVIYSLSIEASTKEIYWLFIKMLNTWIRPKKPNKMTNHLLRMKLVKDNSIFDRNTRNRYLYITIVTTALPMTYRISFPDVSLSQVNFWVRIYFQISTILDEDVALANILKGISIDDLREGQGYVINNTATMRVRDGKLFGYEELIANTYTKSNHVCWKYSSFLAC